MSLRLRVHLALFTVAVIYGSTYSIAKGLMPDLIGPSGFILARIGVAAVLFQIVQRFYVREKVRNRKDLMQLAIAAFFGVAMNMLFFFNGLSRTNELNASVLMLNAPVFVLIFSALILKTRVRPAQITGVILAGLGALLLIGGTKFNFSSETALGDLMVVVNAISFAFYLVYVKRLFSKYSVLTITSYIFMFGFLFVLPVGLPQLIEARFSAFSPWNWAGLGFVCIGTTFFAYFLNAWAVHKANPVLVGTYIYLQPLLATLIAQWLGRGVLSPERVIFAALICLGVYLTGKRTTTE